MVKTGAQARAAQIKAKALKKAGKSLQEISHALGVPRAVVSVWLLSDEEKRTVRDAPLTVDRAVNAQITRDADPQAKLTLAHPLNQAEKPTRRTRRSPQRRAV